MQKIGLRVCAMLITVSLVACSTTKVPSGSVNEGVTGGGASGTFGTPTVQETPTLPATTDANIGGTSIGGAIEQAMDETDKTKMMHAMDKAPGKSTHWVNANSKIQYTVTPTKKVKIEDKNYCRQYQMTALYTNEKEQTVQGVACIASDGNWHVLRT